MFSLGLSLDSAIYGNASAGNPVETIPAPDFSFNYIDEIDTFERVGAAGYSGSGDAAAFQREAAADVIRDTHDGDGILLEDDPTPWAGVAPTALVVDPGEGQIDGATFTLPAVMTSVASMRYRFDSGSWVGFATASSLGAIAVAAGTHTLSVQTVSTSGLFGAVATSAEFEVDAAPEPTWTDSIAGASTNTDDPFGVPYLQPIVCGTTGNCTKLRFWLRTFSFADDVKMALYNSSGVLLGEGLGVAVGTASGQWVEITLDTPVAVTASTTYKVGYFANAVSSTKIGYSNAGASGAGSGNLDFNGTTYAAFPVDPWGGDAGGNVAWTIGMGMGVI